MLIRWLRKLVNRTSPAPRRGQGNQPGRRPYRAQLEALEDRLVFNVADLSIALAASPQPVAVGQNVTLTATVRNLGTQNTSQSVLVNEAVDTTALQVVSTQASQGSVTSAQSGVVTANLGTLANGATATITVVARVIGTGSGGFALSSAQVSFANSQDQDPNPLNNGTTAPIQVSGTNLGSGASIAFRAAGAGPTATPTQAFVSGLYEQVLHGAPDAQGFAFWTTSLDTGRFSRNEVANFFLTSPERDALIVEQFYVQLLNRPSDSLRAFWINGLDTGNLSLTDVALGFFTSVEYTQLHPTNSNYVQSLYVNLFGRSGSPAEIQEQTRFLDTGVISRGQMVFGFLASDEAYINAVASVFTCILRRGPTQAEVNSTVSLFANGQLSPNQEQANLYAGSEYGAIVLTMPIHNLQFC